MKRKATVYEGTEANDNNKTKQITSPPKKTKTTTSTYIALLRGINISGKNIMKMVQLKQVFESIGYQNVRTYIQSGNIVFESNSESDVTELQTQIHDGIEDEFGYDVPVIVRTGEQMEDILNNCPFDIDDLPDKQKPYVTLLSDVPSAERLEQLAKVKIDEDEEYEIVDREVYILYRKSVTKAKINNNFLEKQLGVSATTRNWNTMTKLVNMAKPTV
jgi:uncharacterized protein (DUF1697 family)